MEQGEKRVSRPLEKGSCWRTELREKVTDIGEGTWLVLALAPWWWGVLQPDHPSGWSQKPRSAMAFGHRGHPDGIAWGEGFRCRGGIWVPLNGLREGRPTPGKWVGPGGVSRSFTQHPSPTQPVWGGQGQRGRAWVREGRKEGACVYADSPSRTGYCLEEGRQKTSPQPGQPQKLPKSGRATGLTGRGQAAPQGRIEDPPSRAMEGGRGGLSLPIPVWW